MTRRDSAENFHQELSRYAWAASRQPVLVAVSGGADSMFLCHSLHQAGFPFVVAHVQHGLRPESDREQEFVAQWAEAWQAPFFWVRLTEADYARCPTGLSLQEKARNLRYQFLEKTLAQAGLSCCLTAHHLDDQAETVLMSLLKGRDGPIRVIPAERPPFARPMLHLHKSAILAWMQARGLPWVEDSSNEKDAYLRNRTRKFMAEALADMEPNAAALLVRRAEWINLRLAALDAFLEAELARSLTLAPEGGFALQFPDPNSRPLYFVEFLIGAVARQLNWQPATETKARELAASRTGAFADTPDGRLFRSRHGLEGGALPSAPTRSVSQDELPFSLRTGRNTLRIYLSPKASLSNYPAGWLVMDADQVQWPLFLRPWQRGDRMRPLGMAGTRKLSDIFASEKWSPAQKASALVFADQAGILALVNFRIDHRARLQGTTGDALIIEWE